MMTLPCICVETMSLDPIRVGDNPTEENPNAVTSSIGVALNSRRRFIKRAATSAALIAASTSKAANSTPAPEQPQNAIATTTSAGYTFLQPAEADFVEALVDHMVPADNLSAGGTDLGINIYFDRALAGNWGNGDRLYLDGPWKTGTPSQGYQLPLTPAQLFRSGTDALDAHCRAEYKLPFSALGHDSKESLLLALAAGHLTLSGCPDTHRYFALLRQCVVEGLFADPIYGGNAGKAGWKMLGFPGVIATHANDIDTFRNRPFTAPVFSISDVS
jgi:gluconate 2-dehydrogenase gamma chain